MTTPGAPTSLHEYDVYGALCEELRKIPSIYRVEKIGDKVYILFREAGRNGLHYVSSDVSRVFEEIEKDNIFEYFVWETSRDLLEISEVERQMLEARVQTRVAELTKNDALGGKIKSVEVRWTFLARACRVLGKDATDQYGVIFVSGRDVVEDYSASKILLDNLSKEFFMPIAIKDTPKK